MVRNFVILLSLYGCFAGNIAEAADHNVAENTPPKYAACNANSDCTAAEHRCGGWSIVNKAGYKEIYRIALNLDTQLVCKPKRTKKPALVCQNKQCTVTGYYLRPSQSAW